MAERVDTARRLAADGLPLRAIADELGVSLSSVNNYLRARSCPGCGGPVTSPRAARCATCTAHEPTIARVWTREGVGAAIRDWQAEHGRAPSYRDWTPSRTSPGRWEAESPRWPSAALVCDLYDDCENPWNGALLDAGADVRFRRWSEDAARVALAAFWVRTGRPPLRTSARRTGTGHTHRRSAAATALWPAPGRRWDRRPASRRARKPTDLPDRVRHARRPAGLSPYPPATA